MISNKEELQRLLSEEMLRENPPAGRFAAINVSCHIDANIVLNNVKELLAVVFRYVIENPFDEEVEPAEFAIDHKYWASVIPSWFLRATPFYAQQTPGLDRSKDSKWTVESWLYWFISPHEDRHWRWWSASLHSESQFVVRVQVREFLFLWGSLQWAFFAAGGATVELVF